MKYTLFSLFLLLTTIGFSQLKVGDSAPDFNLKNTDTKMVSLSSYDTKGAIIIFTCNHCPYAKAYEGRIKALHQKYKTEFPVIAINPNDPKQYPEDSYENMIIRSKKKGFTFPYLFDSTQNVAKGYGALKTPHVYLLEKKGEEFIVKYIGAIDDNYVDEKKVKEKYLENAIQALLKNETPNPATTKAIGCSIKWK